MNSTIEERSFYPTLLSEKEILESLLRQKEELISNREIRNIEISNITNENWRTENIKDLSYMFNSNLFYLKNKEEEILELIKNKNNIFFQRIKQYFDITMAELVKIYLNDKSHENRQNIIKYINQKKE